MGCTILGCGKALPNLTVGNDDLARIVDTSDEWIVKRTGIRERRIARDETGTDLAARAAQAAMSASGSPAHGDIDPKGIDLVICMTITPDAVIPSQAALVKRRLGLSNAVAFDVNAACAGCVYGIAIAEGMMAAANGGGAGMAGDSAGSPRNPLRRALVIGVDRMSRIVDWTDRSTCVLFGDGAGAVVLEWNDLRPGIISSFLKGVDDEGPSLALSNPLENGTFPFEDAGQGLTGGAPDPTCPAPFIAMDGRSVFKFATGAMDEAIRAVLDRASLTCDDIALIVPHQANERIIANVARKMGLPPDLFQLSIAHSANTSAASALMALSDAYDEGRIAPGDQVVMVAFGGGLASGALLFESL